MFQDISLADLSQTARPHSSQQAVRLLSRPAAQLNVREQEEIRLNLLASLYSPEVSVPGQAFHDSHYALPVLMSAPHTSQQTHLLTRAWMQTGLFYAYNLLLLVSDPDTTRQELTPLFEILPDAAEHLCLRTPEQVNPETIQEALAAYLPVQEPHLYLAFGQTELSLLQAMASGFLGLSTEKYSWQKPGFNSFRLNASNSDKLAKGLLKIMDEPHLDWELLQRTASKGQTLARQHLHFI